MANGTFALSQPISASDEPWEDASAGDATTTMDWNLVQNFEVGVFSADGAVGIAGGIAASSSQPYAQDGSSTSRPYHRAPSSMLSQIGVGAFGIVWRVTDTTTCAVRVKKTVHTSVFDSFRAKTGSTLAYDSEYNILVELDHPNIMKAFSLEVSDGATHLFSEFIEGSTWIEHLLAHGPFLAPVTVHLLMQLLSATSHIHGHDILHRDIKPENIMVSHGTTRALKLIDFGLAKIISAGCITVVGTSFYVAPEVLFKSLRGPTGRYSSAADMWSVGVTMYVAWCASPPVEDGVWAPAATANAYSFMYDEAEWSHDLGANIRRCVSGMTEWAPHAREAAGQGYKQLEAVASSTRV